MSKRAVKPADTVTIPAQKHFLVGKWFHTFNSNGAIEWQGKILEVDGDVVVLQLYEWFTGFASKIECVEKSRVYATFALYHCSEDMNYEYKMYRLKQDAGRGVDDLDT